MCWSVAQTVLGALSFLHTSQVLWGQDLPPGTVPHPLLITPDARGPPNHQLLKPPAGFWAVPGEGTSEEPRVDEQLSPTCCHLVKLQRP